MGHTNGITRRNFLGGTAGAALPVKARAFSLFGLGDSDAPDLYPLLSKHSLRDQSGKEVSVRALQKQYGDKFTTLSATFIGCNNGYCQFTNQKLGTLKDTSHTTHFILSLNPEFDGGFNKAHPQGNQGARDALASYVKNYLPRGNFVLLYPASTQEAKQILADTGHSVQNLDDNPQHHTPDILLFAPGGRFMDKKNGVIAADRLEEWDPRIQKAVKLQQGAMQR